MKQYTLYLDESETHQFDAKRKKNVNAHFCMAGIIVEDADIEPLDHSLCQLKRAVWPELPNPESVILHQMNILNADKGRLDETLYPEYKKFRHKQQQKLFYGELKKVFVSNPITILGSSIHLEHLQSYYGVQNRNKPDRYLVAMQLLLENYCHFLCAQNARGRIIYEYIELLANEKLRDRYYHIKLMGSMYIARATAEQRLLGLDFVPKTDNVAGLQIADFIPNAFARDHAGYAQGKYNIFSTLKYHCYDGLLQQPGRFGVKYMP